MARSGGGGAREYAPGSEEWMRLEAAPIIQQDAFSDSASWRKPHREGVPFFAYPMLAASVFAISSAGAAFAQIEDVPSVTLAAWRLQLTSVLLMCGALWQWHRDMDPESQRRALHSWRMLLGSGICLALHFGFWVYSLEHTSLTHSLLLVCSVPVIIAGGMIALRKPISKVEILGSIVGFLGGLLLALGPRSANDARIGDLAALVGAVVFIGYLAAGRTLRQWMPIFVYAFPVTGVAGLLLSLAAMPVDGARLFTGGSQGVVGWLADRRYAGWVVYLSFLPGIVGHTGFNTLLRYLTPLTVSLAFQLEPLVGSLIGWAAGVVDAPGWSTWLGGAIVLAATCVVTAATTRREARQEAKGQAAVELEQVFSSEQQGLLEPDIEDSAAEPVLPSPVRAPPPVPPVVLTSASSGGWGAANSSPLKHLLHKLSPDGSPQQKD